MNPALDYAPEILKEKMRSEDRILVLEPIGEQKSLVDTTQELHAIRGPFDNLWRLKYRRGIVPPALKVSFTSFPQLFKYTEGYFRNRNIKIKEVIDVHSDGVRG